MPCTCCNLRTRAPPPDLCAALCVSAPQSQAGGGAETATAVGMVGRFGAGTPSSPVPSQYSGRSGAGTSSSPVPAPQPGTPATPQHLSPQQPSSQQPSAAASRQSNSPHSNSSQFNFTSGAEAGGQGVADDGSSKAGHIAHSGWRRSAADKAAGAAAGAAVAAREVCRVAVGPPPARAEGRPARVGEHGFGGPLLRLPEELRARYLFCFHCW